MQVWKTLQSPGHCHHCSHRRGGRDSLRHQPHPRHWTQDQWDQLATLLLETAASLKRTDASVLIQSPEDANEEPHKDRIHIGPSASLYSDQRKMPLQKILRLIRLQKALAPFRADLEEQMSRQHAGDDRPEIDDDLLDEFL